MTASRRAAARCRRNRPRAVPRDVEQDALVERGVVRAGGAEPARPGRPRCGTPASSCTPPGPSSWMLLVPPVVPIGLRVTVVVPATPRRSAHLAGGQSVDESRLLSVERSPSAPTSRPSRRTCRSRRPRCSCRSVDRLVALLLGGVAEPEVVTEFVGHDRGQHLGRAVLTLHVGALGRGATGGADLAEAVLASGGLGRWGCRASGACPAPGVHPIRRLDVVEHRLRRRRSRGWSDPAVRRGARDGVQITAERV